MSNRPNAGTDRSPNIWGLSKKRITKNKVINIIIPKTSFKTIIKAVKNSIIYKIKSKAKGDNFPDKEHWKEKTE